MRARLPAATDCEITSALATSPHLRKRAKPRTQPLLPLELWERVLLHLTQESGLWGITEVARDLCNASASCTAFYAAAQPVGLPEAPVPVLLGFAPPAGSSLPEKLLLAGSTPCWEPCMQVRPCRCKAQALAALHALPEEAGCAASHRLSA